MSKTLVIYDWHYHSGAQILKTTLLGGLVTAVFSPQPPLCDCGFWVSQREHRLL